MGQFRVGGDFRARPRPSDVTGRMMGKYYSSAITTSGSPSPTWAPA